MVIEVVIRSSIYSQHPMSDNISKQSNAQIVVLRKMDDVFKDIIAEGKSGFKICGLRKPAGCLP